MSVIQFAKLAPIRKSRRVAALYISPIGPYPRLVHECYDAKRDARTYNGPLPIVAHPPCGPWGQLREQCTKQDPELGRIGVQQVRRWGGVLEHPAHSLLFADRNMPEPLGGPDSYGGRTFRVDQVWLGHKCRKPTWIYVCPTRSERHTENARGGWVERVEDLIHSAWTKGRDNKVTHRICSGPRMQGTITASARVRVLTPEPFARLLIRIASEMTTYDV